MIRLATAALGSPSAAAAFLAVVVGWLLFFIGVAMRYGWWVFVAGVGLGAVITGMAALFVESAGAYMAPVSEHVAHPAPPTEAPKVPAPRPPPGGRRQ